MFAVLSIVVFLIPYLIVIRASKMNVSSWIVIVFLNCATRLSCFFFMFIN